MAEGEKPAHVRVHFEYDYIFKLVIVGESNVGKTALLRRFTDNEFYADHISTIGVDYKIKSVSVGERKIKLELWDTAGQERFNAVVENYYRGAKGVFCVFALNDRRSFERIPTWLGRIQPYSIPKVILVGNKCDIEEDARRVTTREIRELCDAYDEGELEYIETSAFTGSNVGAAFQKIAENIVHQIEEAKLKQLDKTDTRAVFLMEGIERSRPVKLGADGAEDGEVKGKKCGC
jgi:small GTP-binding protein